MAELIIMPKQGLQMTEGMITEWLVQEGDTVAEGAPLFEMETDKLSIAIDSTASGTLLKILHPAGDVVPITEPIAVVGQAGEDFSLLLNQKSPNSTSPSPANDSAPKTGLNAGTLSAADSEFAFDVAVLGAGPGGYEAAIRCADYGLKTVLIEEDQLGGTCLNRGCIPTKALLHGAHTYEAAKDAEKFCNITGSIAYDYEKIAAYKDRVVQKLRRGIEALEKSRGVVIKKGRGVLKDAHTIQVNQEAITASNIILATGSAPSRPPIPGIDGMNIVTSDEVLNFKSLPDSFVIIGGGVIGMEFATLFSALGKSVTVLEMMPSILPGIDPEMVRILADSLKKKSVSICTDARVLSLEGGSTVAVQYEKDGQRMEISASCCIVSVGRSPRTSGIGLENLGILMKRGFVETDEQMRTNIPNIFAIGDITGKIQLAHVASAQGLTAAACCAGREARMRYQIVPACVYTEPEIAYVGLSEQKLQETGKDYRVGSFQTAGNGKAMVMGISSGFAKILSDPKTGEIFGAQIMAPRATDMIAEIAAVMRCEGTIEELADTIHPHPTVSEMILEAAHDTEGLSCHTPSRK